MESSGFIVDTLIKIFGVNYKTSISAIFRVLSLVPVAISYLGLQVVPKWLETTCLVCVFISIIYSGLMSKDSDVTGAGDSAKRVLNNAEAVTDDE